MESGNRLRHGSAWREQAGERCTLGQGKVLQEGMLRDQADMSTCFQQEEEGDKARKVSWKQTTNGKGRRKGGLAFSEAASQSRAATTWEPCPQPGSHL